LARFAERHGLNFIFGDDCEFESAPEIMVDLKNDLELADPTNTQLAEGAAQRGLIRAWGINE
jgi:hypothetical protein